MSQLCFNKNTLKCTYKGSGVDIDIENKYSKGAWKVNSRCFELDRTYFISFISSNVGKFFRSWILKDCIEVQKNKKKAIVLYSRLRQNVKLGSLKS